MQSFNVSPPAVIEQDQSLSQLESVIERGKKAFVEVGKALAEIQVRGLYKRTHATFESYCRGRWGFSRQTIYNYIHATEVVKNVQSTVQSQPSLQQAAEMYVLTPTQQQSVASRVDFQTTTVSRLKEEINRERGKPSSSPAVKRIAEPATTTPSESPTPAALSVRLQAAEDARKKCDIALVEMQNKLRPKVHNISDLDAQQLAERIVKVGYAALINGNHPDTGGNHNAAALLNNAQAQLRNFIKEEFENEF